MEIVLATRNRKKVAELQRIFSSSAVRFRPIDDFPDCPDVVENGRTFRANALKKARAISRCTGLPALADDSGLVVDALGGEPGVRSARYAGEEASDQDNVQKLLRSLRQFGRAERSARFVCCIAFVTPDGRRRTFSGIVEGRIAVRQHGENGFGYDPVFYPEGRNRTFAEMSSSEKDSMSHRARAMQKFARFLGGELKVRTG